MKAMEMGACFITGASASALTMGAEPGWGWALASGIIMLMMLGIYEMVQNAS